MILAFSGTSGSGKSTIIQHIKKSNLFKGRKVIVRNEDSFITIRILKNLLGRHLFSQYKNEKFFKTQTTGWMYGLFKNLSYIFYPIVVYIEFFIDHIWYEILDKKKVFIIDKFIYDHAIQFKHILGIDNIFVRWLYNTYPRPYLSFFIDIDLKNAAIIRNKNNVPDKITSQELFHKKILASYQTFAKKNHLLRIDNNGSLQTTIAIILEHIRNKEKLLKARKVSISGLDGTGKTTVIHLLADYAKLLNINYKLVHFVHNNLLYKILISFGYYNLNRPKTVIYKISRAHSARERVSKTSFIKASFRFFDSYVQYAYYMVISGNRLILFDRYFYDYSVSFEYLRIRWRSFFTTLIPPIRNKFIFVASPEVSYRRKPERVKAFFTECHEISLRIAKEQDITVVKTDNKNPNEILQEVLKSIT